MIKKKKQNLPEGPIDEFKPKRWMVVLALGGHGEDAIKLAKDGIDSDTTVVKTKDDGRFKESKETGEAISALTTELFDQMENFVLDGKNRQTPIVIDLHVCGPMNACVLLGFMVEKVRLEMFNVHEVMVKVGNISCYDRIAASKIVIDYQAHIVECDEKV